MSTTTSPVTRPDGPTYVNQPFENSYQELPSKPDTPDHSHVSKLSRVFNRDSARHKKAAQAMSQIYYSLEDVASQRHEPSNFHTAYICFDKERNKLAETDALSQFGPEAIESLNNCIKKVETNAFVYLCCEAPTQGEEELTAQVDVELCNKYRQQYLDVGRERNGGVIPPWSELTKKEIDKKEQIRLSTRIETKTSNRETVILPTEEGSRLVPEGCIEGGDSLPEDSEYMMSGAV